MFGFQIRTSFRLSGKIFFPISIESNFESHTDWKYHFQENLVFVWGLPTWNIFLSNFWCEVREKSSERLDNAYSHIRSRKCIKTTLHSSVYTYTYRSLEGRSIRELAIIQTLRAAFEKSKEAISRKRAKKQQLTQIEKITRKHKKHFGVLLFDVPLTYMCAWEIP